MYRIFFKLFFEIGVRNLNVFGTIAEYNPFHNGHKYHLDEMRTSGATHIVVAMSGNFVQRGECAVYPKHYRAKAALENGADLVIEIPSYFSVSTAETFAMAGITLLDAIGVNTLSFGSECGDIDKIKKIAEKVSTDDFEKILSEKLSCGRTYAASFEEALREISEDLADIIKKPNNILGVEYVKAINKINSKIIPTTIKRAFVEHDDETVKDDFISASQLRQLIKNAEDVVKFMPSSINTQPRFIEQFEDMILYKLRTMSVEDISRLPDVSEGLENRIYSAIKDSRSLQELFDNIKSKRYTHARIRRIIMSAFLGFEKNMFSKPEYIRVLGFNEKGREILRAARNTAKLPVIMRYSNVTDDIRGLFDIESRCTDIYSLATGDVCSKEMTDNIVIL